MLLMPFRYHLILVIIIIISCHMPLTTLIEYHHRYVITDYHTNIATYHITMPADAMIMSLLVTSFCR